MKKIIVFGGAGFVGSQLCPILELNYDLTIVDMFWFWDSIQEYRDKAKIQYAATIKEDIRNRPKIVKLIKGKDVVINLACLSNDMSSDIDYRLTHDISYNGVMNVIDASMCAFVSKFIQTSTTSVYGVKYGGMVDETDIPEPITQYSRIKAELDNVLSFYMTKDNSNITILRPATLYGYSPRLRLDVMVNTLLHRAVRENKILIEGGTQFRPCLHIDDLCDIYIQCIENTSITKNKIYNVTNENYSVNEIVKLIKNIIPDVELHYQHIMDQRSYKTDSFLIQKDLNIKFNHTLKDAIEPLYNHIKFRDYNKDKTINMIVIKDLINKGLI